MMGKLYTPEEIATRLNVSRQTVYRLLKDGDLRGVKVRGSWRVSRQAWLEFTGDTPEPEPLTYDVTGS